MIYRIKIVKELDQEAEDILKDLHKAAFTDGSPVYTLDEAIWWIAYKHKEPAGFCGLGKGVTPGVAYLCRAGVLTEHRGHGLQTRFLRVREKEARKLKYERIVTDTTSVYSANNIYDAGYKMFIPEKPWAVKGAMYFEKYL